MRAPHHIFKTFKRDQRGAIAIMFALVLPVLLGFVGLGLDVGVWYLERRTIQTAADAAAISATYKYSIGGSMADIVSIAETDAAKNGFDPATDTIDVNLPPEAGPYTGDSAYIEVIIERPLDMFLSNIIFNSAVTARARAVAGVDGPDLEACVLALSVYEQDAVSMNSAGATVNLEGCGIVANSSDTDKAINIQNGTLNADCIGAVGGISEDGYVTTNCSVHQTGLAVLSDPYSYVTVPAYSGCDYSGPGNTAYTPTDGETLSEGVYCDGLNISSGSTVTLDDGIYIIDEGDFTVNGSATVTGNNVTIILTASDGSGMGTINITGGGSVELAAPTSADTTGLLTGDYTGVLFYQDRTGGTGSALNATITGGSEVELGGAVYLPNNDIDFSGGNSADSNGCLLLVAQTISFNGSADLDNECDMYGGNQIAYGGSPGLVE